FFTEIAIAPRSRAVRVRFRCLVRMKGVRRRVNTDEAFTVFNGVHECSFAGWCHRRISVLACGSQIAAGVKHEGVELREIFRREKAAVLGESKFDSALWTGFGQKFFDETRLAVFTFDDGVLKVGRFG